MRIFFSERVCVCVCVGSAGVGGLPLCNLEIIRGSLPSRAAIWEYREKQTESGDFQNGSAIE